MRERGFELVTGGTDTHLILVDLRPKGLSGKEAEALCLRANIVVNKNLIPNDPRPATQTSGLRLGSPAVTTRGMQAADMVELADLMDRLLAGGESEITAVQQRVLALAEQYELQ
jgi:glycine hydroxymethyltransferase